MSGKVAGCQFECNVRNDWGIRGHNVILIRMMYGEGDEGEECNEKK